MLSPAASKFNPKKEITEAGSTIYHPREKERKGLKKAKPQKSQPKWKCEFTESVAVIEKNRKSKSREAISRHKSSKKL